MASVKKGDCFTVIKKSVEARGFGIDIEVISVFVAIFVLDGLYLRPPLARKTIVEFKSC